MIKKYIKRTIRALSPNNYKTLNFVEISKSRILHNLAMLQKHHPNFSIFPVLKSNAYGHGLAQISQILNSANCDILAVDGYFEALRIKDITNHKILVMGYINPENTKLLDTKKCSFVVQDIQSLNALGKLNRPVNIHFEINTGMNRLGFQPSETREYLQALKKYPKINLEGVMTHLADTNNETDDSYTENQVELFDNQVKIILDKGFKPKYIHIAQTAGSTKAHSEYANSLRIGIGMYGINPLSPNDKHFKDLDELLPALELKSTIIKTINLKTGDRVSYNGTFKAPKPMRMGVLALGYYEGVPRDLSNKGVVTDGDLTLPIIGRVCMNHTMLNLDSSSLQVGDLVTVISNNSYMPNSVMQMSKLHGLYCHSVLTGISDSVRRIIV